MAEGQVDQMANQVRAKPGEAALTPEQMMELVRSAEEEAKQRALAEQSETKRARASTAPRTAPGLKISGQPHWMTSEQRQSIVEWVEDMISEGRATKRCLDFAVSDRSFRLDRRDGRDVRLADVDLRAICGGMCL